VKPRRRLAVAHATGSGGVAYVAHIAGFILGMALIFVFRGRRRSIDLDRAPRLRNP